MNVVVRHLVAAHRVADVLVTDDTGGNHHVGFHPSFGWHCTSCNTSRCRAIPAAEAVVIDLEAEHT